MDLPNYQAEMVNGKWKLKRLDDVIPLAKKTSEQIYNDIKKSFEEMKKEK